MAATGSPAVTPTPLAPGEWTAVADRDALAFVARPMMGLMPVRCSSISAHDVHERLADCDLRQQYESMPVSRSTIVVRGLR